MARLNRTKLSETTTHEGARTRKQSPREILERSVMACMLWEDTFYEDGQSVADRIVENALKLSPKEISEIAVRARHSQNLRHVPLLLASVLAENSQGPVVTDAIQAIIARADEPGELLALHSARLGKPIKDCITHAMRKGIARSLCQFDEYQLAKWNSSRNQFTLRDVFRLAHPRPRTKVQSDMWKRLIEGKLETPNTWETRLSAGENKKEVFTELLETNKIGYMALLRNLRNMEQAGVDRTLVATAIRARRGADRVLPFRYISAERHAPSFADALDDALTSSIKHLPAFSGNTVIAVDISGSMSWSLSNRSELKREDVAMPLAGIFNGNKRVIAFGSTAKEVPARMGLAQRDSIINGARTLGRGTDLATAVRLANRMNPDRIIVITDEQSMTRPGSPCTPLAYMINVGTYENGVGYGEWTHISGWSERVLEYIHAEEQRRLSNV